MNQMKKSRIGLFAFLPLVFIISACNQFEMKTDKNQTLEDKKKPHDDKKPSDDKSNEERIKNLEGSMRALKDKVSTMESTVGNLKTRSDSISDSLSGPSAPARIDTTVRDFSIAKNMYGSFLVACDGITPYLTGWEVKLTIGNLTSARFDGYKLKVKWGDRTAEFKKTDTILPGTWAYVTVVITPAKADAVRKILVYLEMEDVVLKKNK
jgi:hypothetical protein